MIELAYWIKFERCPQPQKYVFTHYRQMLDELLIRFPEYGFVEWMNRI